MVSYQFNELIQVEFTSTESQVLEAEIPKSNRYLMVSNPSCSYAFSLNHTHLSQEETQLFEAGDLIPSLTYYWLSLCSRIIRHSLSREAISILSVPSKNLLVPLCVNDLCEQIHSHAWSNTAEVLIAWDVKPTIYSHSTFPIKCSGAVFPIIEGLGIGWRAIPEEFIELSALVQGN